jgi:aminoglycoside phosphotransferase (APT) family kinase protein
MDGRRAPGRAVAGGADRPAALDGVLVRIGATPADARELPGGSVNRTYRVARPGGDVVVRIPVDPRREDEFPVEEWAAAAAARAGIPVPAVLERGVEDGVPYLVQEHVPPHAVPVAEPWTELGRLARAVGRVDLADAPASLFTRFGRDLGAAWDAHVAYGLASLDGDDPLLRDGAYPADAAPWLRERFAALAGTRFDHGLAHGDLAPRNLLSRGPDAAPVLLDWGAAETGPTPWTDARRVTAWTRLDGSVTAAEHDAFMAAAGLDGAAAQRTLVAMTALHLVDVTRWARERRPDLYAEHVDRCRAGLARLRERG